MDVQRDAAQDGRSLAPVEDSTGRASLSGVLSAAQAAWTWFGTECAVYPIDDSPGIIGAVRLPRLSRVEVLVDDTSTDAAWTALRRWELDESLRLCAVVPLSAMGRAHDALRGMRCDLQAWWFRRDGSVAFGSVEMA